MPFEIPSSWEWCNLEDICVFLSRGKSPKYSEDDRTYPVFAQKCNLKDGDISLEQARFLDPSTVSKWDDIYKLQTGDVLINSTGTGTVGRTRLFDATCLGNYPFVVPDSHVSVIRTSSQINSKFVFAYISSKFIQQYLEDNLAGSTNQKELYIGVLSTLRVPIPSFSEQERIVVEIEKWFALIDQIEQEKGDLQVTIKQTRNKILDLAIHGKLVPQDPTDEPALELLKRISPNAEITCDNGQYGKIPRRWGMCKIGDLFDIVSAKRVLKSDWQSSGIPFYRAREIVQLHNEGKADKDLFITEQLFLELKEKYGIPSVGDIMLSAVGSIGYTYIVNKNDTFYYKDASVLCLRNINNLNSSYFSLLFETTFMKEQMYDNSKGTTVDTITIEKLRKYYIPLPPLAEQQRIVAKIEKLFEQLDYIENSLEA